MLYNVTVTHVHTSPSFWISFPFRSPQNTEKSSLCCKLVAYFIHSNVYMSIPISQFIPPPLPLVSMFILSISAVQTDSSVPFSRFHLHTLTYDMFLFLSDLFHLVWQSLGTYMFPQIAQFHSSLWLSNIPLYICTIYPFFIHSSVYGHLGCFHVLAIVNSTTINIGVHVTFWIMVFSGCMPRSDIDGSYGSSVFNFLGNFHTAVYTGYINLHSPQQYKRIPFSPQKLSSVYYL